MNLTRRDLFRGVVAGAALGLAASTGLASPSRARGIVNPPSFPDAGGGILLARMYAALEDAKKLHGVTEEELVAAGGIMWVEDLGEYYEALRGEARELYMHEWAAFQTAVPRPQLTFHGIEVHQRPSKTMGRDGNHWMAMREKRLPWVGVDRPCGPWTIPWRFTSDHMAWTESEIPLHPE